MRSKEEHNKSWEEVIRDKIRLYELEIEILKILYPKSYEEDADYKLYVYKIGILEEMLGESDEK